MCLNSITDPDSSNVQISPLFYANRRPLSRKKPRNRMVPGLFRGKAGASGPAGAAAVLLAAAGEAEVLGHLLPPAAVVVRQGGLDGLLGQHGAVHLVGGQAVQGL